MTGRPRGLLVLREGVAMARAQPVGSTIAGLIVAAVCAVVLATTGQSAAAERDVLGRIDQAGTRLVVVTDTQGSARLTPRVVDRVARLSGVEWAVGLTALHDARAVAFDGDPVAVRTVYGRLPPSLALEVGRWPREGEVVVGPEAQAALRLETPAGGVALDRRSFAVVGRFRAEGPLEFLNRSAFAVADTTADGEPVRLLHVLARAPEDVEAVARAVRAVLDAQDSTGVVFETSAALAQLRQAVAGELGQFSRRLVALVQGVSLVLIGLAVYGAVTLRRRDFGRRRALGASRSSLVLLVLVQTSVAAVVGAAAGTALGLAAVVRMTGLLPSAEFALGVAVMSVLTALLAAVPPAILSAFRDPVRVLRVP